jgi:serine/threonine-protein kinase RsbT
MNTHYQRTLQTLERFLSPATARALIARALKEHGLSPANLTSGDLIRMEQGLRRGMRLFVDANQREIADRELALYCGGDRALPESVSISIESEGDISRVRSQARKLCTACGANPYSMQKIATVVSELARNIVLYAGKGKLTISPRQQMNGSSKATVVINSSDEGPGIPNLDQILSGRYQSRTGLGKGLLGTKRLAESFDVQTSARGTTITVEIAL